MNVYLPFPGGPPDRGISSASRRGPGQVSFPSLEVTREGSLTLFSPFNRSSTDPDSCGEVLSDDRPGVRHSFFYRDLRRAVVQKFGASGLHGGDTLTAPTAISPASWTRANAAPPTGQGRVRTDV